MGVRVTEAEAEELQERAQAARLSMGAYLRRRALGQRVRSAVERRLGAAELRELNRIGVTLNQMARALNSGAVSARANIFGRLQTQFEESLGFVCYVISAGSKMARVSIPPERWKFPR